MIFDSIVGVLTSVFTGILGLLPAYSLPGNVTALMSNVGSALAGANSVFPVVQLGLCLGVIVAARVFILGWAVVVWLYDKFPFKAT